jgi:amidase
MLRIKTDQAVYAMSGANPAAARAQSGSTVIFETMDCFDNQIASEEKMLSGIDWNHINPATGPLYVEGAEPGDILKVEILDIRLGSQAVMTALPGEGAVGELIPAEGTKILPVRDGIVRFSEGLSFAVEPMIGVIGTAPLGDPIPTGTPGTHGGNMDNRRIAKGSTVYLPVNVPGALLAIGDLHALMSDGEVLCCGAEIAGEAEVRVSVVKGETLPLPIVATPDTVMTVASCPTLDDAALLASHNMMRLISERGDIDRRELAMLLSLKGQLCICQIVDPLKTARLEFPLELFEKIARWLP